jgi:HD domain
VRTPAVDDAITLAGELLKPLSRRWRHVKGVGAVASLLAQGLPDDEAATLVASAWLHDIGYAPAIATTRFHPLDGARFLEQEGLPAVVVSLVAYHSGAIYEADERDLSRALSEFAEPPAHLLARLTAADMSTSPDGDPIQARKRIAEILSRYPEVDPVHRAVSSSGPELISTTEDVLSRLGLTVEDLSDERSSSTDV